MVTGGQAKKGDTCPFCREGRMGKLLTLSEGTMIRICDRCAQSVTVEHGGSAKKNA